MRLTGSGLESRLNRAHRYLERGSFYEAKCEYEKILQGASTPPGIIAIADAGHHRARQALVNGLIEKAGLLDPDEDASEIEELCLDAVEMAAGDIDVTDAERILDRIGRSAHQASMAFQSSVPHDSQADQPSQSLAQPESVPPDTAMFSWQVVMEDSVVLVDSAEAFLRAQGYRVFSTVPYADMLASAYQPPRTKLYVWGEDCRECLEALLLMGFLDGIYATSAAFLLLDREPREFWSADHIELIQRLTARLDTYSLIQSAAVVLSLAAIGLGVWGVPGVVAAVGLVVFNVLVLFRCERGHTFIQSWLRSEMVPPAEIIVDLARRGSCEYAVFLRSFAVLREFLQKRRASPSAIVDPYEARIVEAVRYGACMPVVALTDPEMAQVPVAGACRFEVKSSEDWAGFALDVLGGAALVVAHVTELSRGFALEVELIRRHGLLPRTVFVERERLAVGGGSGNAAHIGELAGEGAVVLGESVFDAGGLSEFIGFLEQVRGAAARS